MGVKRENIPYHSASSVWWTVKFGKYGHKRSNKQPLRYEVGEVEVEETVHVCVWDWAQVELECDWLQE